MSSRRIVGLGLCVVDHLCVVERLDLAAERTRVVERRVSSGGMVATALVQAAALGCRAELLSMLGDDADGRFLRAALGSAGVATRRVIRSPRWPTSVAVVLVRRRGGERRFLVPDRRALERSAPRFDLDAIDRRCVLLLDGHFPAQALRAARRARRVGATVIGDFSRPDPGVRALLPYVDYPIVPSEFAEAYAEGDAHRALRRLGQRYGGSPVVTQGARGGLYLGGARVRRFRAPRVAVRDTTGAGDVFHGAFSAGLCHGLGFREALDLAARAAAKSCTALGGTARLLTRREAFSRGSRAGAGARRGRG